MSSDVVLAATAAEWERWRASGGSPGAAVYAPSVVAALRLRASAPHPRIYDDGFPADRAWAAQRWLAHFLREWYLQGGKDVTVVPPGVSLGRMACYPLGSHLVEPLRKLLAVHEILSRHRPARMGVGASLGSSWYGIAESCAHAAGIEVIRLEAPGEAPPERVVDASAYHGWISPRRESAARRAGKLFVRGLAILPGRRRRGVNILALHYGAFDAVWRAWADEPAARHAVRLRFLVSNRPRPELFARLVLRGAQLTPDLASVSSQHVAQVLKDVRAVLRTCEWGERFRLGTIDAQRHLGPRIEAFAEGAFPAFASTVAGLDAGLQRDPPDVALLPFLGPPQAQALRELSPRLGFSTAYLPHGMPCFTEPEVLAFFAEDFRADVVFVPSRPAEAMARRLGAKDGAVRLAPAMSVSNAIAYRAGRPERPPSEPGTALLLDYARVHEVLSHRERTGEEYFLRVPEMLLRAGFEKVTYKIHPGRHNLAYYAELRQHLPPAVRGKTRLVKAEPILPLVDAAGLVVGPISTVALEAAVLGRPYLVVHLDDFTLWPPFGTEDCPVARSFEELEGILQEPPNTRRMRDAVLRDACGLDPLSPVAWRNSPRDVLAALTEVRISDEAQREKPRRVTFSAVRGRA